jgi:hypothetical protein
MSHYCSICCVSLSSSQKLKSHLLTTLHKNRSENQLPYICVCGKSFTKSSNLYRHRKKCSYAQTNQVQTLTKENNEMREIICKQENEIRYVKDEMSERMAKKDKEMNDLRKQVEMLLQQSGNKTTNNSNIKHQTNIDNQYIVVNSFGSENIDHLTDQIICKLIQTAPFTCVPELIQKIHFDPEHPENHNIKLTNKKMNYAEIVKNNKWVTANKKQVIDDVIQNSYNILDEKYADNKDSMSEKRQDRFENFQDKYEDNDEEIMRNMKNDVDLILINGTNEVHK